jgi:hypothetical protein
MRMLFSVNHCSFSNGKNSLTFPSRVQAAPHGSNTARATNIFEKKGTKTPIGEIQKATGIAREDKGK